MGALPLLTISEAFLLWLPCAKGAGCQGQTEGLSRSISDLLESAVIKSLPTSFSNFLIPSGAAHHLPLP